VTREEIEQRSPQSRAKSLWSTTVIVEAMSRAKTEWLIENFVFADNYCVYARLEDRQRWNIPKVAGKHLFTACK
jgi:hypothetical protein